MVSKNILLRLLLNQADRKLVSDDSHFWSRSASLCARLWLCETWQVTADLDLLTVLGRNSRSNEAQVLGASPSKPSRFSSSPRLLWTCYSDLFHKHSGSLSALLEVPGRNIARALGGTQPKSQAWQLKNVQKLSFMWQGPGGGMKGDLESGVSGG